MPSLENHAADGRPETVAPVQRLTDETAWPDQIRIRHMRRTGGSAMNIVHSFPRRSNLPWQVASGTYRWRAGVRAHLSRIVPLSRCRAFSRISAHFPANNAYNGC